MNATEEGIAHNIHARPDSSPRKKDVKLKKNRALLANIVHGSQKGHALLPRNAVCYCGSKRKYKNCCGKRS